MSRIPHKLGLNLHAIQHPPLHSRILNIHGQESAVRRLEFVPLQDPPHAGQFFYAERNIIRDAPEEREGVETRRLGARGTSPVDFPFPHARRRGHERVGNEEAPVEQEDQRAGEVPAKLDGHGAGVLNLGLDMVDENLVARVHGCPDLVLGGNVHGTVEGPAPLDVGAVVMRVADDNGLEATQLVDVVDGFWVEESQAVPEDVASGRADKNGPLSNGKLGCGGDGNEALVAGVGSEFVAVLLGHFVVGRE